MSATAPLRAQKTVCVVVCVVPEKHTHSLGRMNSPIIRGGVFKYCHKTRDIYSSATTANIINTLVICGAGIPPACLDVSVFFFLFFEEPSFNCATMANPTAIARRARRECININTANRGPNRAQKRMRSIHFLIFGTSKH